MATVAVVQIGSILARLASGTQRSTLAVPWAMAGALSALAMAAAEALNNVLRCISVSRIPVDERGPPAFLTATIPRSLGGHKSVRAASPRRRRPEAHAGCASQCCAEVSPAFPNPPKVPQGLAHPTWGSEVERYAESLAEGRFPSRAWGWP